MAAGTLNILIRSMLTTALAVVASLSLLMISRGITGVPYHAIDLIECVVFPILVSMPISWYIFSQGQKLKAAHQQLVLLNADTERAYDRLREAHEIIAFSSRHDHMTGLFNREHFLNRLAADYSPDGDAVLLIIDADNFKRINDTFGHPKGDEALVLIADVLRRNLREGDRVGRIGGEEFGMLLRGLSVASAADLAEGIRHDVASIDWRPDGSAEYRLSVSIGGAAFRDCPNGLAEVLLHADRCLYEAKRSGRNRIAFSSTLSDVAYAIAQRRLT